MDGFAYLILTCLVLAGALIGYPIGYRYGQLSMLHRRSESRRSRRDVLSAEYLEEKK